MHASTSLHFTASSTVAGAWRWLLVLSLFLGAVLSDVVPNVAPAVGLSRVAASRAKAWRVDLLGPADLALACGSMDLGNAVGPVPLAVDVRVLAGVAAVRAPLAVASIEDGCARATSAVRPLKRTSWSTYIICRKIRRFRTFVNMQEWVIKTEPSHRRSKSAIVLC
jgi:hypothetical protein